MNYEQAKDSAFAMGIRGAWLVLGGRDFTAEFESPTHIGYDVSNSCGAFTLAVRR